MGETFGDLVTDGPLLVAAAVAALVGLISFASPCVLPLVPGYLSYVTGLVGSGAARPAPAPAPTPTPTFSGSSQGSPTSAPPGSRQGTPLQDPVGPDVVGTAVGRPVEDERAPRGRMVLGAVLFVLGFTAVFVAYGAAFGGLGRLLLVHAELLDRVFGVITIVLGLGFLGWLPLLQRTQRLSARPAAGLAGAPLLGIVFGLGWTPCLGPTLGAVNALAYNEATAGRGVVLGVAYCLGLGVPFVLVAMGARWAVGATSFLRRHAQAVTRVGGAVLIVVGVMLVTGAWTESMQWLRSWLATYGLADSSL
ncbi:cytochrome c biogenesis protein CcdA [Modestobacter sp. I12A-02628]|uniref:Cytochrome c biogenesis protein CcdA n=1 Tax=Goekera deserti TaxID=2497753 RepID=A0A7K3W929_9ACTN|nr:cytochrome c biogenesis CcdA family protein [Goekera deserti]MPR00503.1 cytochrome c biogenesis protein CcdA [Goekera deserti]NDI49098.1 cytochrome c biogenesis protein CcdA [Goekera deserti]NEL52836.1 cytochrome c biogenesis protein CcdA [Goekera deserti]